MTLFLFLFRSCQVGGRRQSLRRDTGAQPSGGLETSWSPCLDPEGRVCRLQRSGLWLCCFCEREMGELREICVEDQT